MLWTTIWFKPLTALIFPLQIHRPNSPAKVLQVSFAMSHLIHTMGALLMPNLVIPVSISLVAKTWSVICMGSVHEGAVHGFRQALVRRPVEGQDCPSTPTIDVLFHLPLWEALSLLPTNIQQWRRLT
jgi:hypothetical protein